jgi:hypothetical protein
LAIMEAMMALYAKEVATPDAVAAAISRLSHLHQEEAIELNNPTSPQLSLLSWLNCSSKVMNTRLKLDGASNNQVRVFLLVTVKNIQQLSAVFS